MDVPKAVFDAYVSLRAQYEFYVALEHINGKYYVYRHKSIYDKEKKKRRTESEYLGKITEEGAFIKKSASKEEKNLEIAKAIIEFYGGKIEWQETNDKEELFTSSEIDNKILMMLSNDARESISNISRAVGLSDSATAKRIRNLEERYGIRYTIDSTLERFHYYQFIATATFIEEKPDYLRLKPLFEEDPRIRLVLCARGAYDLFIFMFAKDPLEAEDIIYALRSNELLAGYKVLWNVTYHSQAYGFIPFRDKFFDLVGKNVWRRTKETPRKKPEQFFFREYVTMRELNQSSKVPFNQIDQKHHLKEGSARYTYNLLLERENKSELRPTIIMERPPVKGTAVFTLEQIDIGSFNKNKKDFYRYLLLDSKNEPLNKFLFSGDIGSPYGVILIAPLYKNGDLERLENELLQVAKGTKIMTSMVSNILVGNIGYRKITPSLTRMYKRLQEGTTL
jgi:DNA-binding Lrp family transcriptional regulator